MKKHLFAALLGLLSLPAFAQDAAAPAAPAPLGINEGGVGDLMLTPVRVVFEGRKRTENVMLNNRGSKEATYRVTLTRKRMLEDGSYVDIDAEHPAQAGEQFADDLVRYSPRQVTLKPGETQTVKFMVKIPDGTPAGEYRSHILFNAVPDTSQGADLAPAEANPQGGVTVRLTPIYGISIPLIVRSGDLSATAQVTAAKLSGDVLDLSIARQGSKSVYGDITVTDGKGAVLGQMNGVAVFTPNVKRNVKITLSPVPAPGVPLSITYRERQEDGGKVIAAANARS